MPSTTRAALGLRSHSGWAALVAFTITKSLPLVLLRRRIEISAPADPRQPYHAAEGLPLAEAEKLIARCAQNSEKLARIAFAGVLHELTRQGYQPVACAMLLASGRPLPALATTLASHALIHTAEGELYRNVLMDAAEHFSLPITRVKEKELMAEAVRRLRKSEVELLQILSQMGKALGPPWRQDEKFAALAAWLALSATT